MHSGSREAIVIVEVDDGSQSVEKRLIDATKCMRGEFEFTGRIEWLHICYLRQCRNRVLSQIELRWVAVEQVLLAAIEL